MQRSSEERSTAIAVESVTFQAGKTYWNDCHPARRALLWITARATLIRVQAALKAGKKASHPRGYDDGAVLSRLVVPVFSRIRPPGIGALRCGRSGVPEL